MDKPSDSPLPTWFELGLIGVVVGCFCIVIGVWLDVPPLVTYGKPPTLIGLLILAAQLLRET